MFNSLKPAKDITKGGNVSKKPSPKSQTTKGGKMEKCGHCGQPTRAEDLAAKIYFDAMSGIEERPACPDCRHGPKQVHFSN